jgi:signal transduction histidine kinase
VNDSPRLFAGPLRRSQLIALDMVAALVFALVALTATASAGGIPPWARVALALGLGLPLALRRVWPLPVFLLTAVLAITAAVSGAFAIVYVAPAYALYLVAVAEDRGNWLPTSAIGVLALLTTVGLVAVGATPSPDAPAWLLDVDETLFGIAVVGGAWTTGRAVRERRKYAARHAERRAEQAVAEERLRIARELHDVVTHNVGLIAVKAGVANHLLATRPEEAHDALRVIETASRNALVEMRHLLGVLRSGEAPARGPAPGLRGLADLAEQARQAGVDVELDVRVANGHRGTRDGPANGRGLPEGVELSVYRIVQEALTNVVKHAAPASCRVSVVDDGQAVRIEVKDDGHGRRVQHGRGLGQHLAMGRGSGRHPYKGTGAGKHPQKGRGFAQHSPEGRSSGQHSPEGGGSGQHAQEGRRPGQHAQDGNGLGQHPQDSTGLGRRPQPGDGPGHGLIGMRERVMMYGGTFEAGATGDHGFRVVASLPYGGEA